MVYVLLTLHFPLLAQFARNRHWSLSLFGVLVGVIFAVAIITTPAFIVAGAP